jgi:hypothetical protein
MNRSIYLLIFIFMAMPVMADYTYIPSKDVPSQYVMPAIGIDLGAGIVPNNNVGFYGAIYGGITFFYSDLKRDLINMIQGLLMNTTVLAGVALQHSTHGLVWAPTLSVIQVLGPFIFGLTSAVYTPSNFTTYDVRLYPHMGLTWLNVLSLTTGPNLHLGGERLPQVATWKVQFALRLPIQLIQVMMGKGK